MSADVADASQTLETALRDVAAEIDRQFDDFLTVPADRGVAHCLIEARASRRRSRRSMSIR